MIVKMKVSVQNMNTLFLRVLNDGIDGETVGVEAQAYRDLGGFAHLGPAPGQAEFRQDTLITLLLVHLRVPLGLSQRHPGMRC